MMVTRQIPSASLYISRILTQVRKQILILQKKAQHYQSTPSMDKIIYFLTPSIW